MSILLAALDAMAALPVSRTRAATITLVRAAVEMGDNPTIRVMSFGTEVELRDVLSCLGILFTTKEYPGDESDVTTFFLQLPPKAAYVES